MTIEENPSHLKRRIPLTGCPNFRDFGGYTTVDGRQVKNGMLFRSGHLAALTDADVEQLAELEIELICDFRQLEEQQRERSRLPREWESRIAPLSITPGNLSAAFADHAAGLSAADVARFMMEINREFALGQRQQYTDMFVHMLDTDSGRTLVHCAAGKDRTGFAAAVILLALGVSRDVVMSDYMLTQHFFLPEREMDRLVKKYEITAEPVHIRPMLEAQPHYLQSALDAIDEQFPDVETYLDEHLGVDRDARAALRDRYLEQ